MLNLESLEKILKDWENKQVILNLSGMITIKLLINQMGVIFSEKEIIISDKNKKNHEIIINKYQIMKLEFNSNEDILIHLDSLQNVIISKLYTEK